MRHIYADRVVGEFVLGYEGENDATTVHFDLEDESNGSLAYTALLTVKLEQQPGFFPVALAISKDKKEATWLVSNEFTSMEQKVELQVTLYWKNTTKTKIFNAIVKRSLIDQGPITPDQQNFIDQVGEEVAKLAKVGDDLKQAALNGEFDGKPGPQGEQGIPGETGPIGPQGLPGIPGKQGEQGKQGIQGETGPIGPQGLVGPAGKTGERGPQGERGATGETGPVGPKGEPGKDAPQIDDSQASPNNPWSGKKTADEIQQLEDGKADRSIYLLNDSTILQSDARDILEYADQYTGIIEFLSTSESKLAAIGYILSNGGNTYLVTINQDGIATQWNRDTREKHLVESRNYVTEPCDIDNLTIDVPGDAPFYANVANAFNKPEGAGSFGVVFVIAYSVDKQIQYYQDIESGVNWQRLVSGVADRHSFGQWEKKGNGASIIDDTQTSPDTTWSSQKVSTELDKKTDLSLGLTATAPGDLIKVKSVGPGGVPTAWERMSLEELEGKWELIETIVVPDGPWKPIIRTEEPDGTPYNFKAIAFKITKTGEVLERKVFQLVCSSGAKDGDEAIGYFTCPILDRPWSKSYASGIVCFFPGLGVSICNTETSTSASITPASMALYPISSRAKAIKRFSEYSELPADTEIKIYGVRA